MQFKIFFSAVVTLAGLCSTSPTPESSVTLTSTSAKSSSTRGPDPEFPIPGEVPFNTTFPNTDYALIAALKTSPNAVTRTALLRDEQFKFDFLNPPAQGFATLEGRGGKLVNAFSITFPALVGNNMAMAVGFTKPCGFNTPHTHPRATELSIVVNGSMISEFVSETGARKVRNVHSTYSMVLFPAGSLHLEFNPNCEPMTFVAAFNSEDPGINTPAESLFMLDDDLVGLATGLEFLEGADIDLYRHLVPSSLAQGVESCLVKCGIKKTVKV
ncbi:RmlC-like cupin domain-containing protein [Halenospora varia]|nr:RmlC-like cupin domain-containing protein [Halenospora varia]